LHPDLGVLAQYLSVKTNSFLVMDVTFLGEDNEWLILYSKTRNQALQLPYFWSPPFTNESLPVGENAEYVNLGDWITYFTYGVLMGTISKSKSINYSLFMIFNILLQV
jgi:UDP-2,3-diacylglucosamine hydrolase